MYIPYHFQNNWFWPEPPTPTKKLNEKMPLVAAQLLKIDKNVLEKRKL